MPVATFLRTFRRLLVLSIIVLLLETVLGGVLGSSITHAATGSASFGLQPTTYDPGNLSTKSYFIFNARAGTTVHSVVRVINNGTAAGTASLYPVDATTGQTSGVVFRTQNDVQSNVGSWLSLATQHVTLAPGQSQLVPFQFTIPSTGNAGQHLGGIVVQNATPQRSTLKHELQVTVQNLAIIAVQINLPGLTSEQLSATGIQAGGTNNYQNLQLKLSNTGTMMVKGNGSLHITDTNGALVQTMPIALDTILPDTSITYPVFVQKKVLPAGDYQASLVLQYGHGKTLNYSTKFTISQQQVSQVFSSTPLQAPSPSSTLMNAMPLWQIIVVALAAIIILFMGGQKLFGLVSSRQRKQKEE
jgi:hypothetical protein